METADPQYKDSGSLSVHIPKEMEAVLNPQVQTYDVYQTQNPATSTTGVSPMGDANTGPTLTCKNPTMLLNELRKGLEYQLVAELGEGMHKQYTVSVVVDGEKFEGTAKSKKLAKQEASKFALLKLFKLLYIPEEQMTPEMMQTASAGMKRKSKGASMPQKKKRRLVPKNALMVLNEFKPGLEFSVVSSTGPVHSPNFIMVVEVDEMRFEGCGNSKKVAKQDAAEKALQAFPEKYNQYLEEQSVCEKATFNVADSTTSNAPISEAILAKSKLHPLLALNELRPGLQYLVVDESGLPHARCYTISVMVDGETFHGTGRSKREAKQNAAAAAFSKISGQ